MVRLKHMLPAGLLLLPTCAAPQFDETGTFHVPRLWDDAALRDWAMPLAGLGQPPSFESPESYYARPVDNLRTWPVYHPDREPPGYREQLVRNGPQPLIDPRHLRTERDWIEAGRLVFEALDTPGSRSADPSVLAHFTNAESVDRHRGAHHDVITKDGILLDYRWVVDRDGQLKISVSSCFGCHSRLMEDGNLLFGAPSNYDLGDSPATGILLAAIPVAPELSPGERFYAQYGVPWCSEDPHERLRALNAEQLDAVLGQPDGAPPGTIFARFNGSPLHPTRMADLRGIRHRQYLDVTGTHRHRGPADLARYAILVEYADSTVFGPHSMLPEGASIASVRPPDEAMYAMALYLESLEPAPSPHPYDELAQRGSAIFREQRCDECHPPPHYTNNRLVAVDEWDPPLPLAPGLSARSVGTDPGLALHTRKGTGTYRVPSLRGLWYRGLYEHSGSIGSLEEWFDPARLSPTHVPGGWRGPGVQSRAVPGHEFVLYLPQEDKRALIAFLQTL
jgi:hypothetical protein